MNMDITCCTCILGQFEKVVSDLDVSIEEKRALMKDIMAEFSRLDIARPAPFAARELYRFLHEKTGIADPYRDEKKLSNENALSLLPRVRPMIRDGDSPLVSALKIAMSGNIIDYGAPGSSDIEAIIQSVKDAVESGIDHETVNRFAEDAQRANHILYIGDNSGEIVFDRELIQAMDTDAVTYAVRGGPIINDATREDAASVGMERLARVIDTGDSTPGIDLSRSSPEFLDSLKNADLVILKGQGNLETMYDADLKNYTGKNVPLYFLLKVKCRFVSRALKEETGNVVFLRRQSW